MICCKSSASKEIYRASKFSLIRWGKTDLGMTTVPLSIAHYQQAVNIAQGTLGENHPNTVTITNNYLQMLRQAPTEEILKALPEEMHENYLKMRSDRKKES